MNSGISSAVACLIFSIWIANAAAHRSAIQICFYFYFSVFHPFAFFFTHLICGTRDLHVCFILLLGWSVDDYVDLTFGRDQLPLLYLRAAVLMLCGRSSPVSPVKCFRSLLWLKIYKKENHPVLWGMKCSPTSMSITGEISEGMSKKNNLRIPSSLRARSVRLLLCLLIHWQHDIKSLLLFWMKPALSPPSSFFSTATKGLPWS